MPTPRPPGTWCGQREFSPAKSDSTKEVFWDASSPRNPDPKPEPEVRTCASHVRSRHPKHCELRPPLPPKDYFRKQSQQFGAAASRSVDFAGTSSSKKVLKCALLHFDFEQIQKFWFQRKGARGPIKKSQFCIVSPRPIVDVFPGLQQGEVNVKSKKIGTLSHQTSGQQRKSSQSPLESAWAGCSKFKISLPKTFNWQ